MLTCRAKGVRQNQFAFRLKVNHRREVRLTSRNITSSRRFRRSIRVIKGRPDPLPYHAFTVIVVAIVKDTKIREHAPITLAIRSTRRTNAQVRVGFVSLNGDHVLVTINFIIRNAYRCKSAPIVMDVFRDFDREFVIFVTERMTGLILPMLNLQRRVQRGREVNSGAHHVMFYHARTDLMDLLRIRIAMSLCVEVHCRKNYVVAGRNAHVISNRFPRERSTTLTKLLSRQASRDLIRFEVGGHRRQVVNARDIPWERGNMSELIRPTLVKLRIRAGMASIDVNGRIKLRAHIMGYHMRRNALIIILHVSIGLKGVDIPLLTNDATRAIGVPSKSFNFRVLTNAIRVRNERACLCRCLLVKLHLRLRWDFDYERGQATFIRYRKIHSRHVNG